MNSKMEHLKKYLVEYRNSQVFLKLVKEYAIPKDRVLSFVRHLYNEAEVGKDCVFDLETMGRLKVKADNKRVFLSLKDWLGNLLLKLNKRGLLNAKL